MRMKGAIILMLVVLLAGCGLSRSQKKASLSDEEIAKVDTLMGQVGPPSEVQVDTLRETTPDVIRAAFEENPLNANSVYDKQWIKMRGKLALGPVKSTMLKGIYAYTVSLEHKNKTMTCVFFGKAKEEELKQLKKGQTLVVLGRYEPTDKGPMLSVCSILSAK